MKSGMLRDERKPNVGRDVEWRVPPFFVFRMAALFTSSFDVGGEEPVLRSMLQ